MNYSMCQEKLDERLDQLRARVQDGTVSRADARAQGLVVLQEIAGECAECEAELREHLNVRLTFLSAEPESVVVPPTLRANVRRALEREQATRSPFPARRPWTSFIWTGGAMLSALGLFLIARPLLIERAQEPVVPPASPSSAVVQDQQERVSPTTVPTQLPATKRSSARPAKPANPAASTGSSQSAVMSPLPTHRVGQPPRTDAAPAVPLQPPTQPIVPPLATAQPPLLREMQRQRPAEVSNSNASPKKNSSATMSARSNPLSSAPSLTSPSSQVPGTSSDVASSSGAKAKTGEPRLDTLAEPQLDSSVLAPTGEKLGMVVRFSSSPRMGFDAMRSQSGGVGGFGGSMNGGFGGNAFGGGANAAARTRTSKPEAPATVPSPKIMSPALGAPTPSFVVPSIPPASDGQGRINALEARPTAPSKANKLADAKPQGTPLVSVAPSSGTMSASQAFAGAGVPGPNVGYNRLNRGATLPFTVSVSVASPVVGARVQGRIKGKMEEGILLWSGNMLANQPVSVSLTPLKVIAGDEVEISMEQQVSLGQTRKLATTSVVVP